MANPLKKLQEIVSKQAKLIDAQKQESERIELERAAAIQAQTDQPNPPHSPDQNVPA